MEKKDFQPQTVVRNKITGKIGVVCPDLPGIMNPNTPREVSVVYDGETEVEGTDYRDLQNMGPENAVPDPIGCGEGRGEERCIFLSRTRDGLECLRFGDLRWNILLHEELGNRREPELLYPLCKLEH